VRNGAVFNGRAESDVYGRVCSVGCILGEEKVDEL